MNRTKGLKLLGFTFLCTLALGIQFKTNAAEIVVTSTEEMQDAYSPDDGICSLREAIISVNTKYIESDHEKSAVVDTEPGEFVGYGGCVVRGAYGITDGKPYDQITLINGQRYELRTRTRTYANRVDIDDLDQSIFHGTGLDNEFFRQEEQRQERIREQRERQQERAEARRDADANGDNYISAEEIGDYCDDFDATHEPDEECPLETFRPYEYPDPDNYPDSDVWSSEDIDRYCQEFFELNGFYSDGCEEREGQRDLDEVLDEATAGWASGADGDCNVWVPPLSGEPWTDHDYDCLAAISDTDGAFDDLDCLFGGICDDENEEFSEAAEEDPGFWERLWGGEDAREAAYRRAVAAADADGNGLDVDEATMFCSDFYANNGYGSPCPLEGDITRLLRAEIEDTADTDHDGFTSISEKSQYCLNFYYENEDECPFREELDRYADQRFFDNAIRFMDTNRDGRLSLRELEVGCLREDMQGSTGQCVYHEILEEMLRADLNHDGIVDSTEMGILCNTYFDRGEDCPYIDQFMQRLTSEAADTDGDGFTSLEELNAFCAEWAIAHPGQECPLQNAVDYYNSTDEAFAAIGGPDYTLQSIYNYCRDFHSEFGNESEPCPAANLTMIDHKELCIARLPLDEEDWTQEDISCWVTYSSYINTSDHATFPDPTVYRDSDITEAEYIAYCREFHRLNGFTYSQCHETLPESDHEGAWTPEAEQAWCDEFERINGRPYKTCLDPETIEPGECIRDLPNNEEDWTDEDLLCYNEHSEGGDTPNPLYPNEASYGLPHTPADEIRWCREFYDLNGYVHPTCTEALPTSSATDWNDEAENDWCAAYREINDREHPSCIGRTSDSAVEEIATAVTESFTIMTSSAPELSGEIAGDLELSDISGPSPRNGKPTNQPISEEPGTGSSRISTIASTTFALGHRVHNIFAERLVDIVFDTTIDADGDRFPPKSGGGNSMPKSGGGSTEKSGGHSSSPSSTTSSNSTSAARDNNAELNDLDINVNLRIVGQGDGGRATIEWFDNGSTIRANRFFEIHTPEAIGNNPAQCFGNVIPALRSYCRNIINENFESDGTHGASQCRDREIPATKPDYYYGEENLLDQYCHDELMKQVVTYKENHKLNVIIENIELKNGFGGNGSSSAIEAKGNLYIKNTKITGGKFHSPRGGGAINSFGPGTKLHIVDSEISNNRGGNPKGGAAVYFFAPNGELVIDRSSITGNISESDFGQISLDNKLYGGAIHVTSTLGITKDHRGTIVSDANPKAVKSVIIKDSDISGNTANSAKGYAAGGGAFLRHVKDIQIEKSSFNENFVRAARNTSSFNNKVVGGGLVITNSNASLSNCTISGNLVHGHDLSTSSAAGIYSLNSNVNINNCTIVKNSADEASGVMAQKRLDTLIVNYVTTSLTDFDSIDMWPTDIPRGRTFKIKNSIITGNSSLSGVYADCTMVDSHNATVEFISEGYNLIGSRCHTGEIGSTGAYGLFNAENGDIVKHANYNHRSEAEILEELGINPDTRQGLGTNKTFFHELRDTSVALDKIPTENMTVEVDQVGTRRVTASFSDIGSYEKSTQGDIVFVNPGRKITNNNRGRQEISSTALYDLNIVKLDFGDITYNTNSHKLTAMVINPRAGLATIDSVTKWAVRGNSGSSRFRLLNSEISYNGEIYPSCRNGIELTAESMCGIQVEYNPNNFDTDKAFILIVESDGDQLRVDIEGKGVMAELPEGVELPEDDTPRSSDFPGGIDLSGGSNENPIATDDEHRFVRSSVTLAQYIGILSNDIDPDGDDRSLQIVPADRATDYVAPGSRTTYRFTPSHGTTSISPDGRLLLYTPDEGWLGRDTFNYVVIDEDGGFDIGTVTVYTGESASSGGSDDEKCVQCN